MQTCTRIPIQSRPFQLGMCETRMRDANKSLHQFGVFPADIHARLLESSAALAVDIVSSLSLSHPLIDGADLRASVSRVGVRVVALAVFGQLDPAAAFWWLGACAAKKETRRRPRVNLGRPHLQWNKPPTQSRRHQQPRFSTRRGLWADKHHTTFNSSRTR
jgi:hypothetical protein